MPVTKLVAEMKLKAFKLSNVQWSLAQDLSDLLLVRSSVLNVLFTNGKLFQCLEGLIHIFLRRDDGSRPLITEGIPVCSHRTLMCLLSVPGKIGTNQIP